MQVQKTQETKENRNRAEILNKAISLVPKIHETAIQLVRRSMPLADYFEMPSFEATWIRREIKRLWGIKLTNEEVEYIWLKAILGF